MINGVAVFSKQQWKQIVWKRAWQIEKYAWNFTTNLFNDSRLLSRVMGMPGYCIWWQILLADGDHTFIRRCKVMVICEKCDNFILEDAYHVKLQCEYTSDIRQTMFNDFDSMYSDVGKYIISESDDILATILGNMCPTITYGIT